MVGIRALAEKPNPGYVFVNLGYSFLAAAAGGYVTAWIAQNNPLIHVLALGIIVLLVAALSALQQRGQQPVWYVLTLVALTPLGVFAGGSGASARSRCSLDSELNAIPDAQIESRPVECHLGRAASC